MRPVLAAALVACATPPPDALGPRQDTGVAAEPGPVGGEAPAPPSIADDDRDDTAPGTPAPDRAADTGPTRQACYPSGRCVQLTEDDPGPDYRYPPPLDARYTPPVAWIDLDAVDSELPLSPNFVLSEIAARTKGRHAVVQPHLVAHLQAVRVAIGGPLHVNSGFRSPAYNAGVDGASSSRHQWGDAADAWAQVATLEQLGARCEAEGAGFVLLYETHVHCDWRDDPLSPPFFDDGLVASSLPVATAALDATLVPGRVWTAPASGFDEGEPLRRWTARDASGRVLVTEVGRTFAPPAAAARVEVVVGGRIARGARR